MKLSRTAHIAVAALLAATAAAPAALAGGEPKNDSPFNHSSPETATLQLVGARFSVIALHGEPKNVAPFTRILRVQR